VDHDALVAQAEKLFGHLPSRPRAGLIQPAKFVGGERRENKKLEQVHFALAFEGPDYHDPAIYTAQIYASAMGGGMSSRLFQEIREKRGLCYSLRGHGPDHDLCWHQRRRDRRAGKYHDG
jgi:predicted Zn-dependent peptidase